MKNLIIGCLFIAFISFIPIGSKTPSHGRLCSIGLILKQKQTKTVEWLISWQQHQKKCPVCTKRNGSEPEEDNCGICLDIPNDPITLPRVGNSCGHTFCRNCITQWFARSLTCPYCKTQPSDQFVLAQLGLDPNAERLPLSDSEDNPVPFWHYSLNVSSLFAILLAEGCFAGLTVGVITRKIFSQPSFNKADPQTVFALHYLTLLITWVGTHALIKKIWRPAFDVENPGAQFELARSISRKTKMGKMSLLAGATAGILASKPLLREYEKIAKFLED